MKNIIRFMALLLCAGLVCQFAPASWAEDEQEHGGTITFTKPVKSVVFDHETHLDADLDCESCHEDLFEYEAGAAEKNNDFTMEALYSGKYCGACHDGDTAFASRSNCLACHQDAGAIQGGTIIFTEPLKAVIFSHETHLDMDLECSSCHEELFEYRKGAAEESADFNMEALYSGKYCGACHDGDTAFASNTKCAVCHIGVKGYNRLYEVGGGEKNHE